MKKPISPIHWYCDVCYPQLEYGTTKTVCGWTVQAPIPEPPGGVRYKHCPTCRTEERRHKRSHR